MMGWATPMPMGGWMPLSWGELQAFGASTERLADPWDYETARAMSSAYLRGMIEGREINSIMPIDRNQ